MCNNKGVLALAPMHSITTRSISHDLPLKSFSRQKTVCNLFFRAGTVPPNSSERRQIDPTISGQLESPTLRLPHEFSISRGENEEAERLVVRHMELEDLDEVLKMCMDEFGPAPDKDPESLPDWLDKLTLEPSIRLALQAKMNENRISNEGISKDPAILVLCKQNVDACQVVGLVEISLQPADANKNPPKFPQPFAIKSLYSKFKGVDIEGWVTNLLIDPEYRGLGYSKLLMSATEGIARSWNCNYIFLHADANIRSGKVSQSLYESIGYEVVTDNDPEYAWMPKNTLSSIRTIDGVALLCFRKPL